MKCQKPEIAKCQCILFSGFAGKKSNTSRTVISSVVPIVVFTVLIMCIYIYSTTMKAKESVECKMICYSTISLAV